MFSTNLVTAAPLFQQFQVIGDHLSASNSGQLVFNPFNPPQQKLATLTGGGNYVVNLTVSPTPTMMADNQRFVMNRGGSAITVFPRAFFPYETVADSTTGFTSLGDRPGITEQGETVLFSGIRGNGKGVFAATKLGGTWQLVRIAGEGQDTIVDVEMNSRVVGQNLWRNTSAAGEDSVWTVLFHGTHQAPFGPMVGLFTVDVAMHRAANGTISVQRGPVTQVLHVGQSLGGSSIGSFVIFDSLNRCNEVFCKAVLANGEHAIVRSRRAIPFAKRLRVAATRVLDATGGHNPDHAWHRILGGLRHASSLLGQVGVELIVERCVDVVDPSPGTPQSLAILGASLGAAEASARSQPFWRNDAVNVLFVADTGGNSAGRSAVPSQIAPPEGSGATDIVVLGPQADETELGIVIAHELGHHCALLHTYETALGTEDLPPQWLPHASRARNAATAGDLVADTLPNPNSIFWTPYYYGNGPQYAQVVQNVMAEKWFGITRSRFTTGQGVRVHQALALARAAEVESDDTLRADFLAANCGARPTLWHTPCRIGVTSTLSVLDAPLQSFALVYASFPATPMIFPGGCTLHLDPAGMVFCYLLVAGAGSASIANPIPNVPSLVGVDLRFQAAVSGGMSLGPFDLTNAVALRIGH